MNENTTARNFWYMLALMTWLLLLFCVGLYKYDQSHNKSTQAYNSIKNELRMVQANETALQAQNKALSTKNDVLTATNTQLQQQKSQFCTELSKAKIADPLCVQ